MCGMQFYDIIFGYYLPARYTENWDNNLFLCAEKKDFIQSYQKNLFFCIISFFIVVFYIYVYLLLIAKLLYNSKCPSVCPSVCPYMRKKRNGGNVNFSAANEDSEVRPCLWRFLWILVIYFLNKLSVGLSVRIQ